MPKKWFAHTRKIVDPDALVAHMSQSLREFLAGCDETIVELDENGNPEWMYDDD